MDMKLLPLYFVIGGLVVSAVTFFGSKGQGSVAAFLGLLPSISVITLATIYLRGGNPAALSYFKGLLKMFPPWIAYVVLVLVLLPRIGLIGSIIVSVAAYIGLAFLIIRFV